MNESSDHDVTAAAGDCIADVPAEQLEREAEQLKAEHGGQLPEGESIPDDAELV
jgi:hypothetical protein